ncbi:MAG: two-component system, cell cycle response regulator, partial [Thermoleophilaceae bacterium]|nr:two-component system, cell cycle response regulator [Thermoleophilaceae bacterium]
KAVNDTKGHGAGDDLLLGVAASIKLALRPYDVIARFGGDEFVCSLAGNDLAGVRGRFAEISAHIAETQNGATISVGFAEGGPDESLEDLIAQADTALSVARKGRPVSPARRRAGASVPANAD